LGRTELLDVLGLLETLAAHRGPDPFPLVVLRRLQDLTGADTAAAYVETGVDSAGRPRHYDLATRAKPPWLCPTLERVGAQDPIHESRRADVTSPVAISDYLTACEFHRLDVYRLVCQPLGTADSMRVYLPAPEGSVRYFFFDRSRYGFPARTRKLLELLTPHLAHARARHGDHLPGAAASTLTRREAEVMHWVAAGQSNAEIAHRLWIAEHTVRKHLENVFTKLQVHTRTAAVARLRELRTDTSEQAARAIAHRQWSVTAVDAGTREIAE
jgi:DNA-binding CsgD family transcriptional regulator